MNENKNIFKDGSGLIANEVYFGNNNRINRPEWKEYTDFTN